jgi:hypothetical protein
VFISETVRESKSVNLLLEALNKINSKKKNFFFRQTIKILNIHFNTKILHLEPFFKHFLKQQNVFNVHFEKEKKYFWIKD